MEFIVYNITYWVWVVGAWLGGPNNWFQLEVCDYYKSVCKRNSVLFDSYCDQKVAEYAYPGI